MTYTVVLMREDDGRYSVTVPALKGCHTWGRNLAHALQMAEEVIEGYLHVLRDQGKPIPPDKPRVSLNMLEAPEALVYRLEIERAAALA